MDNSSKLKLMAHSLVSIDTWSEYQSFLKTLSEKKELRFPVKTSIKKDFSVLMIFVDDIKKGFDGHALFIVYEYGDRKQEKKRKNKIIDEVPENVLMWGALEETGLKPLNFFKLGKPYFRKNTIEDSHLPHYQFIFLVIEFDHEVTNGIWISIKLLPFITEPRQLQDMSFRSHPQEEAFKRLQKYLSGERSFLTEDPNGEKL